MKTIIPATSHDQLRRVRPGVYSRRAVAKPISVKMADTTGNVTPLPALATTGWLRQLLFPECLSQVQGRLTGLRVGGSYGEVGRMGQKGALCLDPVLTASDSVRHNCSAIMSHHYGAGV